MMSNILKKIKFHLNEPGFFLIYLSRIGLFNFIPDKTYLKIMYRLNMGKKLNLKAPKTFNEKIQWLKLYDRNPLYATMVDKYEAKKYVADIIGEEYIIPTLGVWDSFEEINFKELPNQFVLKCTHDSGGLVICRDKSSFDIDSARSKINKCLKNNYYKRSREWPYKNVKPRIIAEKYMEDSTGSEQLRDFKFFCFGGLVKCYKIDFDRFIEHHANYYDDENHLLKFGEIVCPPEYNRNITIPDNIELMKKLSEQLSVVAPFLRTDFYDSDGKVYFGELTFYPASGFGAFTSDEWDEMLGSWIKLPESIGGGGYTRIVNSDFLVCFSPVLNFSNEIRVSDEVNNKKNVGLTDYKFYCFNGIPSFLYVSEGLENHSTAKISFLTLEWEFAPFGREDYRPFDVLPQKPSRYIEMLSIASKLSKGHTFLRVDLYEINNKIYFSELTFSPCSGFMHFSPSIWDDKLGLYLELPNGGKQNVK